MEKHPEMDEISSRKRKRNVNSWARQKAKKERYSSPGGPKNILCNHAKKLTYHCDKISYEDKVKFHQNFYADCDKISQDNLILKYTEASKPKRTRLVNNIRGSCSLSIQYFIFAQGKKVHVCQKSFLSILKISKNRVNGVITRHMTTGLSPQENRGGDRRLEHYESKRTAVIDFIQQFKAIESHYSRHKSTRVYLSSDLSITKMWKMYRTENNINDVKLSFFRHVFNTKFNIGFGSPATDICSSCACLEEKIKKAPPLEVASLKTDLKIHKAKAKAFYKLLQDKSKKVLILSFDCQKNQVLPKLADQSAYYSRQLYKYNFTVVVGDSKAPQTNQNTFIYHWDESEYAKGSNEVCSAVFDCLCRVEIPTCVEIVRLVADGCGGQNKNTSLIGMVASWLLKTNKNSNLKKVEIVFPVVGHSFLPPDRVFARIEKVIKKTNIILSPQEYTNIFDQFGTTITLKGKVYDWKSTVTEVVRPPGQWHFKFQASKRFILKKSKAGTNVIVQGEPNYQTDIGVLKTVCRKGRTFRDIQDPREVPTGQSISQLKLDDVNKLLSKHYGDEWKNDESLKYYVNVLKL